MYDGKIPKDPSMVTQVFDAYDAVCSDPPIGASRSPDKTWVTIYATPVQAAANASNWAPRLYSRGPL